MFMNFVSCPGGEKLFYFLSSHCGFTPQPDFLTQEDDMKHSPLSGRKVLCALLTLPLLLSITLSTPLSATRRVVLVEEWENTS